MKEVTLMKKLIVLALMCSIILAGCGANEASSPASSKPTPVAVSPEVVDNTNFTDEMKIPYTIDLSEEDGADSVERLGDHKESPYFKSNDYYNMESTGTLTILSKFRTQQQTSEWSCGVSSGMMVMDWYDALGGHNEESLGAFRSNGLTPQGTSLRQLIQVFEGLGGFDLYSTFDCVDNVDEVFTLEFIRDTLKKGTPIMIGWNDWGGHWQVIIGYDTMGTETTQDDVIIVADSYDTTDHNQDGYGVYPAERFYYNFTFYNFFEEEELNDKVFLIATPKA